MSKKPKTITIFLQDGTPTGRREIEITEDTGKCFILPRKYATNKNMKKEPCIYFLMGKEKGEKAIYVGHSRKDFPNRINDHKSKRKFWDTLIYFTNKKLNSGHFEYLEAPLLKKIKELGRIRVTNRQTPTDPDTSKTIKSSAENFAENIKLLLSIGGFTFLQEPTEDGQKLYEPTNKDDGDEEFLYCKDTKGADAKGKLNPDDSFVVFKGSRLRISEVGSFTEDESKNRKKILDSSAKRVDNKSYELHTDVYFPNPARAATFVLGMGESRRRWKNKKGEKLQRYKETK